MIPAYWIRPEAKIEEAWRKSGAEASTAQALLALAREIHAWHQLVAAFRRPSLHDNEAGGWRAVDDKRIR